MMYQLGRRAGALNVGHMSNQPGERRCDRLCSGVLLEKRWKMFEGRAAQVDLILLLSTREARGANSILRVFLYLCECSTIWMCIYFGL